MLDFCPTLATMHAQGYAEGRSGKHISTGPMSTANNILVLRNLMLQRRPENTLEVGMRMGGSALAIMQTHKDLGHNPRKQHVAMDPYQNDPFNDASGLVAAERAGLDGYLEFHNEPSSLAMPSLVQKERTFQMIYVDGSHEFENVFLDAYFSVQLLSIGGIVVFDDCVSPHIKKVLRFVQRNFTNCLSEIDIAPYRPESALRYRVANAVGRAQIRGFEKIGPMERYNGYKLRWF